MIDVTLAIVGCGNMGLAIARGAIAARLIQPTELIGIDSSPEARERAAALGMHVDGDARRAHDVGRLLLAVKPQSFEALAQTLAPLPHTTEVISIISGWTRVRLAAALGIGADLSRIVRAMPNLPSTLGRGVTAVALERADSASSQEAFAETLFGAVGAVVRVDESQLDAVTALSGSGPAYLFLLAEAMLDAARGLGFDDGTARALVHGTLDGAAAMLMPEGVSAAELRAAVTSRGGTTEAATRLWNERGVPAGIVAAINAASQRAAELGAASIARG